VHNLWKTGASAVDVTSVQTFFRAIPQAIEASCTLPVRLRWSFRLPDPEGWLEFLSFPGSTISYDGGNPVILHQYDQTINGREYHIEVSNVGVGQWRAHIKRTPGGCAALMPFYGKTPDEAAGQLSRWLSIAHGRPTGQS
jgi:hypothetical protein